MSTEQVVRVKGWRRWAPVIWAGYGAVYVAVFLARGKVLLGVITAALVVAIAVGLAVELRRPQVAQAQQLGWQRDERQQLIHQRAMALVGYVAIAGAALGGFVAFLVNSDAAIWPMLAILGLSSVYGLGLALYQRRS